MTHRRYFLGSTALIFATLTGCNGSSEPPSPAPSVQVEMRSAESRSIQEVLTTYGTVEPAASAVIGLAVQYEARITSVRVTSGEAVRKGQPIVELAASATAQLELDKAKRDAALTAAEHERALRLRSQGLATESEVQAAENAAATADNLRDSLIARIGASGLRTLNAPQDGIVDALTAQPGDLLPPGTMVTRILHPDNLLVRFGVEPQDIARLAANQPVRIVPLTGISSVINAQIASVDRRVDLQSRLAGVIVALPRNSALLPGTSVRAQIVLATHENAVGIPSTAVLYAGDQAYVFVADKNQAHRHTIRVGIKAGDWVEVLDGVKVGEGVIVSGNYELEDGMAIRATQGLQP